MRSRRRTSPVRLGAAAALALLASGGAARAETLLRLAETATVMVQPDELAADLAAEASAATPQDAQARVNTAITAALATARGTAGVTVATGRYSVWQVREPPHTAQPAPVWQASQALTLHSADGSATLALVGRLQAQGLAVQSLGWQVSPAASRRASDEARRQALGALRGRAEAAAKLLGLRFEEFRSVDLNPSSAPTPMPRALMAAAMPAPNAVAEAMPVSATVTAEAALAP